MRDNFSNTFKDWVEVILIGTAGFSYVRRSFNARLRTETNMNCIHNSG